MIKKYRTGLMWFRRDLRTEDNAALYHALKSCHRVFCLFIFDRDILDDLPRAGRLRSMPVPWHRYQPESYPRCRRWRRWDLGKRTCRR